MKRIHILFIIFAGILIFLSGIILWAIFGERKVKSLREAEERKAKQVKAVKKGKRKKAAKRAKKK